MKYNNVEFEAIVATPGCGKTYLCEKYPDVFVDIDELRLKEKYILPKNISRKELEASKGDRKYQRKNSTEKLNKIINDMLIKYKNEGKILICAPQPEVIDLLNKNNISFCFIFPDLSMKEELKQRMINRGNSKELIEKYYQDFEHYYYENIKESKSNVHYLFSKNEFLEDILIKFNCKF